MTSPSYSLSKFVYRILQSAITSEYNVTSSYSFCQNINNTIIPTNYRMVSFDVISLFTNIPRELVTRDVINNWAEIRKTTPINLDLFLEIITFCMDSSYFMFRQKYYLQSDGSAMGSPLSPILADLVMNNLIDTVRKQLNFPVNTIYKYVDDLFLLVPTDKIEETLIAFNSYHTKIQFTYEEERDGSLPYLDMTLIRTADNTIRTEWFIKPIASGRMMNYNSMHPLSQKLNVVTNFIKRVSTLSTNLNDHQKRQLIFKHLSINDYPNSLINRYINRYQTHNEPNVTNNNTETRTADPVYRSLPFISSLTPKIINILRKENPSVTIITRHTNTIKKLYSKIKDNIPKSHQHNIVYRIPCGNCDRSYLGMTSNLLKTRLYGHQSNINKLNELLRLGHPYSDHRIQEQKEKTALISHCVDHDHRFDLASTEIMDRAHNKASLPILEMIWIYSDKKCVNKRTDVDNLSVTLSGILHSLQNSTTTQQHRNRHNRQPEAITVTARSSSNDN